MIKKILGDICVTDNGNGYTARHLGKSATCTGSKEGAMDACLRKIYGAKKTFYYRFITIRHRAVDKSHNSKWTDIYSAVSEEPEANNQE